MDIIFPVTGWKPPTHTNKTSVCGTTADFDLFCSISLARSLAAFYYLLLQFSFKWSLVRQHLLWAPLVLHCSNYQWNQLHHLVYCMHQFVFVSQCYSKTDITQQKRGEKRQYRKKTSAATPTEHEKIELKHIRAIMSFYTFPCCVRRSLVYELCHIVIVYVYSIMHAFAFYISLGRFPSFYHNIFGLSCCTAFLPRNLFGFAAAAAAATTLAALIIMTISTRYFSFTVLVILCTAMLFSYALSFYTQSILAFSRPFSRFV